MPRLAANLTMLYSEVPFLDRFGAARRNGFRACEFLFPYAYPAEQLAELLALNQLEAVLHNLPAGNWDAGERGIACLPGRAGEFQDGVGRAVEYARALGVRQVNCLAGKAPEGADPNVLRQTLIDNLRFAANALAVQGIRLLIEPINTRDMPGFYLCRSSQALEVIASVASDNLYLQYDIYHMQVMEGNLAETIKKHLARIAHIQLADNPGRNEPGTGEIGWPFLFHWLDDIGYRGWVGCEYKPKSTTEAGLGWVGTYGLTL